MRIMKLTVTYAFALDAQQTGCLPQPHLQNQCPSGVDRLEQIFCADTEDSFGGAILIQLRAD